MAGWVCVFELPGVFTLVVEETGVVVAFVEVFENGGEDFGEFFGEGDSFGGGFEELAAADCGEEGGGGEDVFVGGEETLFGADTECDDGGGQVTGWWNLSVGWNIMLFNVVLLTFPSVDSLSSSRKTRPSLQQRLGLEKTSCHFCL